MNIQESPKRNQPKQRDLAQSASPNKKEIPADESGIQELRGLRSGLSDIEGEKNILQIVGQIDQKLSERENVAEAPYYEKSYDNHARAHTEIASPVVEAQRSGRTFKKYLSQKYLNSKSPEEDQGDFERDY